MSASTSDLHKMFVRADPSVTTAKNPKLPERWAYEFNHVGVLAELAKVKQVEPDIMSSSLGVLVQKEEEKEWRRKMLEQQQEWQKEVGRNLEAAQSAKIFSDLTQIDICQVVGLLKQQNRLISLLARNSSEANQEQDNGIKLN